MYLEITLHINLFLHRFLIYKEVLNVFKSLHIKISICIYLKFNLFHSYFDV